MKLRDMLMTGATFAALAAVTGLPATAQDDAAKLVNGQVNSVQHPFRPKNGGGSFTANPQFTFDRPPKHLVYVALPGGTAGGHSIVDNSPFPSTGYGIVVLDADHNYDFVKRITWDVPASEAPGAEVAGITANVPLNMLYIELRERLLAFDLKTDKLLWSQAYGGRNLEKTHEGGQWECCERSELTPDGKTLIVGSNLSKFWYVVDAKTGKEEARIYPPLTSHTHNMGLSADGKTAVLAASAGKPPVVSIVDVPSRKVIQTIEFSDVVRPLVVNHDASLVYANVDNLLGFEIGDAKTGKMIRRVEAPAEMWKAKWADPNQHFFGHGCPSHGIALTPDESEIWVVDQINYGVLVYDNTGKWPVYNPKKSFKTTASASWITMGLDGKRAYLASGDVVDVRNHTIIANLKDEFGHTMHSEKMLELAFQDGKLIQAESQFGEGRPEAVAARLAHEKQASITNERQASN
jgi:hypothetical protein